jgi:hypothetical protein
MNRKSLDLISIDELWALREKVTAVLAARLTEKMRLLDNRLIRLKSGKRIDDFRIEDAA